MSGDVEVFSLKVTGGRLAGPVNAARVPRWGQPVSKNLGRVSEREFARGPPPLRLASRFPSSPCSVPVSLRCGRGSLCPRAVQMTWLNHVYLQDTASWFAFVGVWRPTRASTVPWSFPFAGRNGRKDLDGGG